MIVANSWLGLPESIEESIMPEPNSGCWLWIGYVAKDGYGQIGDAQGNRKAHRRVWEHLMSDIPEGLTLDHLCRVRCCVNPDHLEPVTQKVNTHRGEGLAAQNAAKTICKRGHPLSGDNIAIRYGQRLCRECGRMHTRNWKAKQKAKMECT